MSIRKKLTGNFLALFSMQLVNMLLPLLTLPFLGKTLGPSGFGLVMFSQAFIQYFVLITDFGFNLSATRQISINRDNFTKINQIVNAVYVIKLLLLLLSILITVIIVLFFSQFREYWYIYILNFGVVIGNVLFPVWLFQGMEQMRYTTVLNVVAKTIFTASIFLIVKSQEQLLLVPLLNSIGYIVSGVIGLIIAIKQFNLRCIIPKKLIIFSQLKESAQFFISRVSVSAYTLTNTLILGLVAGHSMVAYFSIAEKLVNVVAVGVSTIIDAVYPHMAKSRDIGLFKKIFIVIMIVSTIGCIILFLLSDFIISIIFGDNYSVSGHIFRIMLVATYISIPSMLIGYPLLAAFGHSKYANYSVLIASLIHIIMLLIGHAHLNVYTVSYILIVTQIIVLTIRIYGVKKKIL
ncbi:oligosaccharide flippase family protein [Priestia megaterium]|uniref:oligosaccharide flippase family protein n=1 Tax=Priestia megaterium TaxID=1404 RepID=UPI001CD41136|nr:oligosaccharide flippase family protein [Priestia megaterium]